MEIFWNTIARYNAATWPWQIAIVAAAAVLTVLLYLRPTQNVKRAMKLFLAGLNAWIAVVYYLVWCGQRSHSDVLALRRTGGDERHILHLLRHKIRKTGRLSLSVEEVSGFHSHL